MIQQRFQPKTQFIQSKILLALNISNSNKSPTGILSSFSVWHDRVSESTNALDIQYCLENGPIHAMALSTRRKSSTCWGFTWVNWRRHVRISGTTSQGGTGSVWCLQIWSKRSWTSAHVLPLFFNMLSWSSKRLFTGRLGRCASRPFGFGPHLSITSWNWSSSKTHTHTTKIKCYQKKK